MNGVGNGRPSACSRRGTVGSAGQSERRSWERARSGCERRQREKREPGQLALRIKDQEGTNREGRLVGESGVEGVADSEVDSLLVEIVLKDDELDFHPISTHFTAVLK
jgi:hypothetical protein